MVTMTAGQLLQCLDGVVAADKPGFRIAGGIDLRIDQKGPNSLLVKGGDIIVPIVVVATNGDKKGCCGVEWISTIGYDTFDSRVAACQNAAGDRCDLL